MLVLVIALAHFVNDWYSLLIPPAIPLIKTTFHLNYFETGILVSVPYFVAAILQSFFSNIAERYARRKLFLAFGFLVLSISYMFFASSGSYPVMLVFAFFIGIGLGTYHPQGIGILSRVFRERRGAIIGINGAGGALGYLFAPISMGFLLSLFGLDAYYIVAIPGFLIAFLIYLSVNIKEEKNTKTMSSTITKSLILLAFVALIVPFFSRGVSSFLPAYFYSSGSNILNANLQASVMLIPGLFAQPLGGAISDKLGRRFVIFIGYLCMGIFLFLFVLTSNLVLLFFVGFFMSLTIPVRLVFATEAGGDKVNTNIAIIFGSSMIGASIAPTAMGAIIDSFGFHAAFLMDVTLALLGSVLVWFVKTKRV